jgi:alpha-L-fucosidase
MRKAIISKNVLCVLFLLCQKLTASFSSWDDLDKLPLPAWYSEAKFGIFVHWGVFSVPAYKNEWFQNNWQHFKYEDYVAFVNKTERQNFAYQDYAHRFLAELYRPDNWADTFAAAGAQYVVLTSKHHDGFCMWNSTSIPTTWNWNAVDIGPRRDLLGDLSSAVKRKKSPQSGKKLRFGIYHSLLEFFNPLYTYDKGNNWTTQNMVDLKALPELYDLVDRYEPHLMWSDGGWEASSTYWKSEEFISWYALNSTVGKEAVWNDRWGTDTQCRHGSYLTCHDRYQPDRLVDKKWEKCMTIDSTSWGYSRVSDVLQYLNTTQLVHTLIEVVALNGNLLLNVGPSADGTINPVFVDRLMGIGSWLSVNGEAIYSSNPWKICQNETKFSVFYTRRTDVLYAHITEWPENSLLRLDCPVPTKSTRVNMLGLDDRSEISFSLNGNRSTGESMVVQLPLLTPDTIPCQHSWVLAISNLANLYK